MTSAEALVYVLREELGLSGAAAVSNAFFGATRPAAKSALHQSKVAAALQTLQQPQG